jgi:NAD(P)-dependent dehydrogenase (short-subunit alcohol dehydrogenase family)
MGGESSLAGRVVAVTGANGGIGSYTALGLARLGAHVVLICRTRERAEAAQRFVHGAMSSAGTSVLAADLSSMDVVRGLAKALADNHPRLSVLVNNAGLIAGRRILTVDGFESTLAVNHLAPFLLSTSLLDVLRANAPARIVNVNSDSHLSAQLDLDDLNGERRFWPPRAYGQSKLANMLFTAELARRVDPASVTVNALHPGFVDTDFGEVGGVVGFGWSMMRHFGIAPERGARTPIFCASSPELAGVSGSYFRDSRQAQPDPRVADAALRDRVWDTSERLLSGAHN